MGEKEARQGGEKENIRGQGLPLNKGWGIEAKGTRSKSKDMEKFLIPH